MAIAFDQAASPGAFGPATSYTFSTSTSGSNRLLWIFNRSDSDVLTGVTYNTVAMTATGKVYSNNNVSNGTQTGWILVAPASGSNSVVMTNSSSASFDPYCESYTGAKQTAQPDNQTTTFGNGSTASLTLTPVAVDSWMLFGIENANGVNTAGGGTTFRYNSGGHAIVIGDNNSAINPAAATTVSTTFGNSNYSGIAVTIAPAVASTTNSGFLAFM